MAYTLNSAKDARGDEHLYIEVFNRLAPQIQQYKQQHGGDLEVAFGAVTGTPLPEGRSVKISHGQPELTKDRTVKSVLGKYVALPAAIGATAMFAPGALPAIGKGLAGAAMKGGAGALAGRMAMGAAPGLIQGDWKSALMGAGTGAFTPGGFGGGAKEAGGSVMKDMLMKSGIGAIQGGMQGGLKGAAIGAAGGATSAIPGNIGKVLDATGQSGIGGDIMASIMKGGPNAGFEPGKEALMQQQQVQQVRPQGARPQGW